ncbi:MAG: molybdopterin-dependent oxidoreductase [Nocardioidaceae bacterium]|nr:molybdopterin-dependent oxidoreductase [Nocardioidaceae bacterium]
MHPPTPLRRPIAALAGITAALVGAASGHLVAAYVDPAASPVLAVGSTVIDLTPTPLKEWAVARLGTADKPVLVGAVLVGTLLLAAAAGLVTRRSRAGGAGLLVGLAAVAGVAALSRPAAQTLDAVPAVVTAVVGAAVLLGITRPHPATTAVEDPAGPSRRGLLALGLGLAVALAGAGEWVSRARGGPSSVALPAPSDPAPPLPAGLEGRFSGISDLQTPSDDFYRVDTRLVLPSIDVDGWRLTIDGDVDRTVDLGFADLVAMPLVERDITLTCVSNEVGGKYVGSARWLGVPLRDVLDLTGIDRTAADQILSTDVDGFTISTPLEVALDGRDTLLAVGMNGSPLPQAHGFPVRLVTPGLYGFVGSTKWLRRLTLTTYDAAQAYWTDRGWATDAPIKIASRIDTPRPLSTADAGDVVVGGVAWAQHRGIGLVEVSVDDGPWQRATLGPDVGIDYWRQWFFRWPAEPGQHTLASRATTVDGEVQTERRASPFPDGSSGVQQVVVNVA